MSGSADPELGALADRAAIVDVIADLALTLDLGEWERYADCFSEDLSVRNPHFGAVEARRVGGRRWMAGVRRTQAQMDARHHVLSTPRIELDGDRAEIVVLQQARFVLAEVPGGGVYQVGGSLRLGMVRQPGRWRIHRLEFDVLWDDGNREVFEEAARRGAAAEAAEGIDG